MNSKTLIWTGIFVGSAIGGYVPVLWGGNVFGVSSIILSTAGALAGIWAGWKLGQII